MFPRPPLDPERRKPERGLRPLPEFPKFGLEEAEGLALIAAAGLAIWQFGFWWGVGVFLVGFALFTFVLAMNEESGESVHGTRMRDRRRTPVAARLHAAALSFFGGLLGFGVAAQIGAGISGGALGIAAAASTYLLISVGGGWLLDMNWGGALGSWCLLMIVWFVGSIPLAAYLAPGYGAHGVAANIGMVICVSAAEWIVTLASPWRSHWYRLRS